MKTCRHTKKLMTTNAARGRVEARGIMRKAIIKRTADILEKLAVASFAVGLFQGNDTGLWWGVACIVLSYCFTVWEVQS